ncbi:hypothetical protein LOTGIDRAFT_155819 [Lottia gigantea]|uniref:Uncharacterized protein n=1 Tax=Lottia gigantea TaxID=225164 RepID=V3ZPK9_LOTGI|nr:hypothetical protein LOTGIDRAFT_155819 [Lottia gigantea]ESO82791.1 hypothetical protein LOTGIDRAFT_155819 [Lottia gigantea]
MHDKINYHCSTPSAVTHNPRVRRSFHSEMMNDGNNWNSHGHSNSRGWYHQPREVPHSVLHATSQDQYQLGFTEQIPMPPPSYYKGVVGAAQGHQQFRPAPVKRQQFSSCRFYKSNIHDAQTYHDFKVIQNLLIKQDFFICLFFICFIKCVISCI